MALSRQPDFSLCTLKANELLVTLDVCKLPIDFTKISIPGKNIIFDTMQNYASLTNVPLSSLTVNGKFNDAYYIPYDGINLILYNKDISSDTRIYWSIAHELGHIFLDHTSDGPTEETEANFFASKLLVPDCILFELIKRRAPISESYLLNNFGISTHAATKRLVTLRKNYTYLDGTYADEYSDIIIQKFSNYLNYIAPIMFEDYVAESEGSYWQY